MRIAFVFQGQLPRVGERVKANRVLDSAWVLVLAHTGTPAGSQAAAVAPSAAGQDTKETVVSASQTVKTFGKTKYCDPG